MRFKKRGAIEVQFNWLFILIAGAIILLFFGMVIAKQRTSSEQKLSASLLVDLESIFTGSAVSKQALNFISIPKKEINFEGCDFYYIGKEKEFKTKLKRDIKENIIFTPDLIKGTRLTIWSLPWDIPYRVTNFLYLTSPQVRYIIVYDDTEEDAKFANKIEELLPPETLTIDDEEYTVTFREKKEKTGSSFVFDDLNNYKVKFIFLDVPTSFAELDNFNNMKDEDVRAIKIDGDIDDGEIIFYKKSGDQFVKIGTDPESESSYFGDAALIGAIFAEDKNMYGCAMQNAFKRMGVVTNVYSERTTQLWGAVSPECQNYYDSDILPKLAAIRAASGDFDGIINTIKTNQITDQDKNCPLVY